MELEMLLHNRVL